MTRTALILGPTGRFGRHAARALSQTGWDIRKFDRSRDTLPQAAMGVQLIVNGWNTDYATWAENSLRLTNMVISAARQSGAAVIQPGNLYVYGADLPPVLSDTTPHRATNPLGRIRREMEDAYRKSGVKTVVLRAGDFLDTEASGNWFDMIIAAKIKRGKLRYPGPLDRQHSWAYLPDLAKALAQVAERLDALPDFTDLPFEGYNLTGQDLSDALARVAGREMKPTTMSWLPIHLARPFWGEAKHILEMRYLWNKPHRVDGGALADLIGPMQTTPLDQALAASIAPLLQNEMSTQTSRWSEAS